MSGDLAARQRELDAAVEALFAAARAQDDAGQAFADLHTTAEVGVTSRMPGFGLGSLAAGNTIAVDYPDEPAQHIRYAGMRGGGEHQRRLLRGALEPRDLLLELLG